MTDDHALLKVTLLKGTRRRDYLVEPANREQTWSTAQVIEHTPHAADALSAIDRLSTMIEADRADGWVPAHGERYRFPGGVRTIIERDLDHES